MADEMVLAAQKFINETYEGVTGIPQVEENGLTGWPTMYALTRCLQYELGITTLSDNFGTTTLSTLTSRWPSIDAATAPSANVVRIIQSGLYCKGYDGGGIDGVYSDRVAAAVEQLKANAGVDSVYPGDAMVPKLFKALLNMDAYVTISGGSDTVRSIQQWMNSRYIGRANFFVIPCDGFFSRDVQKALMFAIQYTIGMSDDVANGVFGPGTQAGIKANTLSVGSTGTWVQLFSAAMVFNQRSGVSFTTTYDNSLASAVRVFQDFVKLPVTGAGDFQTWASLLVSTGDPTRQGTALDCVTSITANMAAGLKSLGYDTVGRYLCNVANTDLNKMIQPGELDIVMGAGIRVFPIYQTYGGQASYFTYNQGKYDALSAIEWARYHGFKDGTRIYFAVDYDALDYEVTDNILPHFQGVHDTITETSNYTVGVYGPRNICSRVSAAGYAGTSFVSDMSTGFSGNLGYPMPENWAFDQIATTTVGLGDEWLELDNDIASGRDTGQSAKDPGTAVDHPDVAFDMDQRDAMLADVQEYLTSIGVPESGGSSIFDDDEATEFANTTTEAFDVVVQADWLFTALARTLGLRKALIQAPVLWEIRKYNALDLAADAAVEAGAKDDCTTGLGQIYGWVAIDTRNYCIQQGIINGTPLDPQADLHSVWQKLHDDPVYNITTAAYLTLYNAYQLGDARPTTDISETETQALLARYNGTGDAAQAYGQSLIGLYRTLEKYYAPQRGQ